MITYSTNMMGPVSMDWYRKRGLTETVGEFEEVTTYYAGGRIDIRGVPGDEYWNGWHEYSVPIMHGEDWNALGDYLWDLATEELLPYDTLIEQFETHYGKKIRWADSEEERLRVKKKLIHDELYDAVKMEMFKASSKLEGIDMQDIRLIAGEGKLTEKTVQQAIEIIRKQRKDN